MRNDSATDQTVLAPWLAGASTLLATARATWLITGGVDGTVHARPMGALRSEASGAWSMLYLTTVGSRKVADIRRSGASIVIVQRNSDAFATLGGMATVLDDATEVRRLWITEYDGYFPTEQDRSNAALIKFEIKRMDLWIRGVTPEPFGFEPVSLELAEDGQWRMGSDTP